MNIKLMLTFAFISTAIVVRAQEKPKEYNPFEGIGKKGKILTASNGKYIEVFDYDSIQRIGSVMFNISTKKIVKLLPAEQVFRKFSDNSSASRWWSQDPLAEKTYSWSPYHFVFNNPIRFNDPDGREAYGDFYNTKGQKIGTDGIDDKKVYLVYARKDVKTVENNTAGGKTTQTGDLKDPLQLPTLEVRGGMNDMVARSNSPNDKRTDVYAGNDNQGGMHEEGGYFSMDKLVNAKPGPKTLPSDGNGTVDPFVTADGKPGGIGKADGTVHIHPRGTTSGNGITDGGSEFVQTPSRATTYGARDDYSAFGAAQKMGWVSPQGYGIVIGAQRNQVTFYNANGDKTTIPLATFLNIGK